MHFRCVASTALALKVGYNQKSSKTFPIGCNSGLVFWINFEYGQEERKSVMIKWETGNGKLRKSWKNVIRKKKAVQRKHFARP
jgi:hypothetical protein